METRANYALIGLFTLAVIIGAFLVVFWIKGTTVQYRLKAPNIAA